MISHDGGGLIFVLSTPRAGSTLTGAILGSHSEIMCPPEPWFMLPLLGLLDKRHVVAAPYDHDLAYRATVEFLDEPLFREATAAFAMTVYNGLLRRDGKKIFADKNGRYYHIIKQLYGVFPRASYIWLKRSPLDVIASYKSTWSITPNQLFGKTISFNSFDVTAGFTYLIDHFRTSPPIFEMKYEDLVLQPGEIVAGLCRALRVTFEETMLQFFTNESLIQSYAGSTFGDKKIHRESSIHPRSIGAWRKTLTREEVCTSLLVLGSLPFTGQGYDEELAEAVTYADLRAADVQPRGRLDAYEQVLAEYPVGISSLVTATPPQGSSLGNSSLILEQVFQRVLEEKEVELQAQAHAAAARLELLQTAEAARAALQRALEAKVNSGNG